LANDPGLLPAGPWKICTPLRYSEERKCVCSVDFLTHHSFFQRYTTQQKKNLDPDLQGLPLTFILFVTICLDLIWNLLSRTIPAVSPLTPPSPLLLEMNRNICQSNLQFCSSGTRSLDPTPTSHLRNSNHQFLAQDRCPRPQRCH
jgi:hypothetical protein